ncbi:competence/damage-inducible protein A [Brackiella oedipodis]|uniref:competence/damage-inducible protein A n=1 Tax=Brackiella oedipodis TaxID=124225 RepID=UPI00048DF709|nr:competence/damage-inducible protein A [Brackiella oedipodis]
MSKDRDIGLFIIGDEILSGRRQDKHFSKVVEMLKQRGLQLSWAMILPDDLEVLVRAFNKTLEAGDIVFSCGGIGATPDDKTREAIAKALGVPLELHPEAEKLISERFITLAKEGRGSWDPGSPENQRRLAMGVFPEGAEIVPNPYNQIPGFFIQDHTFVPGFPEMAWPMLEWTLDHRYADMQRQALTHLSVIAYYLPESRITPALEYIELHWPGVHTFSLPTVPRDDQPGFIDLGVKGPETLVHEAFDYLKGQVLREGGRFKA